MGFIFKKAVVSFRLFLIETLVETNGSLEIALCLSKKNRKIKQKDIINIQYFVFQQF